MRARASMTVAATALLIAGLTGCTGSSAGVTVQDPPATSASPTVDGATPTAAAPPATAHDSATAPTSVTGSETSAHPFPARSTAPISQAEAAREALAAFKAFDRTTDKAEEDPTPANQAAVVRLLSSPSVGGFGDDIGNLRATGLVYKGLPDDPRVHVVTPLVSSTLALLRSCPLVNAKSPFLPYFAATGKPALPGGRSGPRYWVDITEVKVAGVWKVKSYFIDRTEQCDA